MRIPARYRLAFIAIIFIAIWLHCACTMSDELEGTMTVLRLEKIDTVYRYQEDEVVLLWVSKGYRIITREKLPHHYKIGTWRHCIIRH